MKLEKSNCDETQKLKMLQNSNSYKTQKVKMQHNSKTRNVKKKIKNSKYDKTKKKSNSNQKNNF